MKRVPPARFDDYPPAHLYLDDVDRIARLLATVGPRLTITADDHEFAAVSDLPLLNKEWAAEVKIEANEGEYYMYFEVRPFACRLFVYNADDVPSQAVASAVKETVWARRVTRIGNDRWRVYLRKSSDPAPPKPPHEPSWIDRNQAVVAAVAGAVAGSVATALLTVLLIWAGVLKTAG